MKEVNVCCHPCGATANALTCLKKYGWWPKQLQFSMSTWSRGVCDCCGKRTDVTEARDYFYPDFSLIGKVLRFLKKP